MRFSKAELQKSRHLLWVSPFGGGGGGVEGEERIVGTAMLVPKRKIALDYLQSALSTVENREVAMLI